MFLPRENFRNRVEFEAFTYMAQLKQFLLHTVRKSQRGNQPDVWACIEHGLVHISEYLSRMRLACAESWQFVYNCECIERGSRQRPNDRIVEKVEAGIKCGREKSKGVCEGKHHRKDHAAHVFWNLPLTQRFRPPPRLAGDFCVEWRASGLLLCKHTCRWRSWWWIRFRLLLDPCG